MGFSNLFTNVITAAESIPQDWYPGKSYTQNLSLVSVFGINGVANGYYTCIQTNSDLIFTPSKWTFSKTPTFPVSQANNFQKTQSNSNNKFKTINIWNDQIDTEIKEQGYIVKCPALFIEFIPEEPKQILGGVTQYPEAKMYFHIYSDQLNSPNYSSNQGLGGDFMDADIEIYNLRDIVKSTFLSFHTYNSSAFWSRYDALDYKHKQITKYLLGFGLVFTDDKGSILTPCSSRYLTPVSINATLESTVIRNWISGTSYLAFVNVVNVAGISGVPNGLYLCTTTNNNSVFTPSNWAILPLYVGGSSYLVGQYVYLADFCYQCNTANSDTTFNSNHWNIICRI